MTFYDQKYVEDPMFIQWVFRPSQSVNQYWENYLSEHPGEEVQILELKSRLIELQSIDQSLLPDEKEYIAAEIISRIEQYEEKQNRRVVILSLLKYAAVGLIFAVVGGLVVYSKIDKGLIYKQLAGQIVRIPNEGNGPVLITSGGENLSLKKNSSSVDYSQNGAVVLNNDSVLKAGAEAPNTLNQLIIPYGNQSKLTLSDHTIVWLNAGSRLVYPTNFSGKTREVLLYGEAFFEVSKDADKPFVVKTSDVEIKVLGTQFDVSAYAEDRMIQTILKEGSVEIRNHSDQIFDKPVILKPNQMASFSKTNNSTELSTVDVSYYTLWTKGLLCFDDFELDKVLKKIERFYNVSVDFSEPELRAIRISGKLDLKRNRDEVLEYLEKVSRTKIKKLNENQFIVNK